MCQRNKNIENKHVSLNCYSASFFLFSAIYNYIRKSKINCQPKSGKDIKLSNCQIVKLSNLKMKKHHFGSLLNKYIYIYLIVALFAPFFVKPSLTI